MEILTKILNEEIIKKKDINNDIVKYLLEKNIQKNEIDILITKITNENYMKKILNQRDRSQKFSIPTPDFNDFLIDEDTKTIIILTKFINDKQFENLDFIQNEGYGKEMCKLLEKIKLKFLDYNLTIDECEKIYNLHLKNMLDSRLNLIFYKKDDTININELKNNLIQKIEKAEIIKNNIFNNYNYLNNFCN